MEAARVIRRELAVTVAVLIAFLALMGLAVNKDMPRCEASENTVEYSAEISEDFSAGLSLDLEAA